MPERLPEIPRSRGGTPSVPARVAREARRAEMEVYRHQLDSAVLREKSIIDVETLTDVMTAATDEELAFLSEFRSKAGQSEAALVLVARKVEMLDSIVNRSINRRFRG